MWVGWGLQPLIVPIGVDVFFLFSLVPPHLGNWVGVLGVFVCFTCIFWSIGVCVECVFPLSNIANYRKNFLYSSTNCDSKIATPTLVENPCSLHGSHKNYYPVAKKLLQVLRTRGSITLRCTQTTNLRLLRHGANGKNTVW